MEFLKLLLNIDLILITAMTVCATKNSKLNMASSPHNIGGIRYHVRLITDIQESNVNFHGECNVSMEIRTLIYSIDVHLLDMNIDESATTLSSDAETHRPSEFIYDKEMGSVHLFFGNGIAVGNYILSVRFSRNSPINENHFSRISYTSVEGGRVWLGVVPLVPISVTGRPFPCWDELALKQRMKISIKHNDTFKALSNSPVEVRYTDEDGMVWTEFDLTHVMSTCLVAIVLTDLTQVYENSTITNVWGRPHLTPHMRYAQSVADKVREYMVEYTKKSNNGDQVSKIHHVAIPNFARSGMSFWGLALYNESDITYNSEIEPLFRQRNVAKLIAHTVLQQWFGGLAPPAWLPYTWLSEGLSSFFQSYVLDKIYENSRIIDFLVIEQLHTSFDDGVEYTTNSVVPQISNFSERTVTYSSLYNKASALLRMLQHIITDEVFKNGIILYLQKHQFISVASDDLWLAMQTAALKRPDVSYFRKFEIKEVMDTWIKQTHYPLLTVTRDYETGHVLVIQEHFAGRQVIDDSTANRWWIPVTWTTQTDCNFSNTLPMDWLTPVFTEVNFNINANDWIIVNVQQTGYYRVDYDTKNWEKIGDYLNSENYSKIHVLNRAQIIDDVYALLIVKRVSISLFLKITNYLSRETDYIAWHPMFRILSKLLKYFSLPESTTFKLRMSELMDGLLKSVGYEEQPNEDDISQHRRLQVTKWACLVGNAECKRMATAKLEHYLADVNAHKVPAWWHSWMYCFGLMTANEATWNKTMNLYIQKRDKSLLQHLACSEDSNIIINYLNIIVTNSIALRHEDYIFALDSIIINHARNGQVLKYILTNFERVKPKSYTTVAMLENLISNVHSKQKLDKIELSVTNNFYKEISAEILPILHSRVLLLDNLVENFPVYSGV
ncbi:PREDICTED: aminopeptidase N-like [Vollenhovia emeryi]|uniref:aminopeptidase N-like n=1 Tax=Vollenhovia emeryi TaxID=411798 RepID=UPI0005F4F448|nr:PREDICTED: aminopeptidase N-like [Vollenhovia emeryi]XP_011871823.1 PREDICTED: aminopeptidase N-like [Vollenhovia emeryi]